MAKRIIQSIVVTELILLVAYIAVSLNAGAHNLIFLLLLITQFAGVKCMQILKGLEGSLNDSLLRIVYYTGVYIVQVIVYTVIFSSLKIIFGKRKIGDGVE